MTDTLADALRQLRPAWMRDAACTEYPQDMWFPSKGATGDAAKAICEQCLVRAECLAFGIHEQAGIWGGTTYEDRKRLRKKGWKLGDPLPALRLHAFGMSHGTERASRQHRRLGEPMCPACRAYVERRRAHQRRQHQAKLRAVA